MLVLCPFDSKEGWIALNDFCQVHNIVDKACKEMGMEKLLHDLQNVWKELNFDYEDHVSGNVTYCIHLNGHLIINQATNC